MSTYLNENANVSLDSNANANAISRNKCKCFGVAFKCIQKCFGYTFANAFELISNVWLYINVLFYLEKKNIIYTSTLLIYLINTVVHYCKH